jgi:hypothetical protein
MDWSDLVQPAVLVPLTSLGTLGLGWLAGKMRARGVTKPSATAPVVPVVPPSLPEGHVPVPADKPWAFLPHVPKE